MNKKSMLSVSMLVMASISQAHASEREFVRNTLNRDRQEQRVEIAKDAVEPINTKMASQDCCDDGPCCNGGSCC